MGVYLSKIPKSEIKLNVGIEPRNKEQTFAASINNPKIFWFCMAASCSLLSRTEDSFLLPLCSSASIEI